MTWVAHMPLAMATVAIGSGASACTAQPTGTVPTHDAAAAPLVASFEAGASDADNADTADEGEAAVACTVPQECILPLLLPGAGIYGCCIDHVCTRDVPKTCPDGSSRPIKASNYDQSCKTDTDCVVINEGNACSYVSGCGAAAINRSDSAKYQSDIANVPCEFLTSCGRTGAGRNGQCQWSVALCDALPQRPPSEITDRLLGEPDSRAVRCEAIREAVRGLDAAFLALRKHAEGRHREEAELDGEVGRIKLDANRGD